MSETPGKYTTRRDRRAATKPANPQPTMPSSMTITTADLDRAGAQLAKSERGRQAARDLLNFIQSGGGSLDADNQLAYLVLLRAAWGEYPGSVRDVLLEVI